MMGLQIFGGLFIFGTIVFGMVIALVSWANRCWDEHPSNPNKKID